MAKYRKKPVIIEAFQVGLDDKPVWFEKALEMGQVVKAELGGYDIITLEGVMRAERTDFIIKGIKNELYPCKESIFEATYEPVKVRVVEGVVYEELEPGKLTQAGLADEQQ